LSENFEFFGYGIASIFAITWLSALVIWQRRGRVGTAP